MMATFLIDKLWKKFLIELRLCLFCTNTRKWKITTDTRLAISKVQIYMTHKSRKHSHIYTYTYISVFIESNYVIIKFIIKSEIEKFGNECSYQSMLIKCCKIKYAAYNAGRISK
jgi:hypothetical protein